MKPNDITNFYFKPNDITNAYFNIVDLKKTISSHGLRDIKRVHGGSDNEDTIGDLVDDLEYFITKLDLAYGVNTYEDE